MMRSGRFGNGYRPVSRRGVLIGALAVIAGAGGGVAAGVLRPLHRHHPGKPAPADLVDALAAERALIARLQAKTGRSPALRTIYDAILADHVAHQTALSGALEKYEPPTKSTRPAPVAQAPSKDQQRSAEATAAARAAKRAARLSGPEAALLASIAASEASHAEALR